MFVASSLYNYATSSSSAAAATNGAGSKQTRVKRHAYRPHRRGSSDPADTALPSAADDPSSPPPSYASAVDAAKRAVVDSILKEPDLYKVLGVDRKAKGDEIRRGFLARSRVCHPDKFPSYAPTTLAFQRVSFAYETLSKPTSRRLYDVSGRSDLAASVNGAGAADGGPSASTGMSDETLNSVLYSVFCEFMDGDFEMIRVLLSAMNEGSAGVQFGDDASENIEGVLHKLREMLLAGKRYFSIVRFELIRLYEIQHSLRQLSYFDVFGRLRLTLQLARVTLSIPMAIDQAMKEPVEGDEYEEEGSSESDAGDSVHGSADEEDAGPLPTHAEEDADFGIAPEEDDEEVQAEQRSRRERKQAHRARRAERRRRNRRHVQAGDGTSAGADAEDTTAGAQSFPSPPSGTNAADTGSTRRRHGHHRRRTASNVSRSGLLGPTTAGLLKGVVKVLETSEGWMPGKRSEGVA